MCFFANIQFLKISFDCNSRTYSHVKNSYLYSKILHFSQKYVYGKYLCSESMYS